MTLQLSPCHHYSNCMFHFFSFFLLLIVNTTVSGFQNWSPILTCNPSRPYDPIHHPDDHPSFLVTHPRSSSSPMYRSEKNKQRRHSLPLFMKIPTLNDWEFNDQGGVRGIVMNHPNPTIQDGELITTSPLSASSSSSSSTLNWFRSNGEFQQGTIVTTSSGSKYKLGTPLRRNSNNRNIDTEIQKSSNNVFSFWKSNEEMDGNKNNKSKESKKKDGSSSSISSSTITIAANYPITGQTIGKGKYLLGIDPERSTSGKSMLWPAYYYRTVNKKKIPILTNQFCVKISPYYEILSREERNYNRVVQRGILKGKFVKKFEFIPSLDLDPPSSTSSSLLSSTNLNSNLCALVMESGWIDLKRFLQVLIEKRKKQRQKEPWNLYFFGESMVRMTSASSSSSSSSSWNKSNGLQGRPLRNAAAAAAQCIQALHTSGLVWTDSKTENFVLVRTDMEENSPMESVSEEELILNMGQVKGIDLESAVQKGDPPTDFSPEVCPPEFASAFVAGKASTFEVDYSYDIWSFGMVLYELSTGKCYFQGKSPSFITKFLARLSKEGTENWFDLTNVVGDENMKDLISQCLTIDPRRRPSITQILLHPYFLTTGVGPYSF